MGFFYLPGFSDLWGWNKNPVLNSDPISFVNVCHQIFYVKTQWMFNFSDIFSSGLIQFCQNGP